MGSDDRFEVYGPTRAEHVEPDWVEPTQPAPGVFEQPPANLEPLSPALRDAGTASGAVGNPKRVRRWVAVLSTVVAVGGLAVLGLSPSSSPSAERAFSCSIEGLDSAESPIPILHTGCGPAPERPANLPAQFVLVGPVILDELVQGGPGPVDLSCGDLDAPDFANAPVAARVWVDPDRLGNVRQPDGIPDYVKAPGCYLWQPGER